MLFVVRAVRHAGPRDEALRGRELDRDKRCRRPQQKLPGTNNINFFVVVSNGNH